MLWYANIFPIMNSGPYIEHRIKWVKKIILASEVIMPYTVREMPVEWIFP